MEDAGYFDREYFELHEGKRLYLDYLVGQLRRAGVDGGRVLDVGSGYGFFLDALGRAGYSAVGLELSPHAAAVSRRRDRARVACGSAEAWLPFADGAFDAVTVHDVIEHVEEHLQCLHECRRVLRPGGRLLLVTLNRFSVARPILGRRWSWYQDPTHVHMFSPGSLRRDMERAGFSCLRSTTMMNFCSVGETTRLLRPLRRFGRVVHLPAFGDAFLLVGARDQS